MVESGRRQILAVRTARVLLFASTRVASALHVDPTWVLLDEPFAGVDSPKAEQVTRALDRLGERLRLLIITEQSPGSFPSANRVIEVRDGEVRELAGGDA